MSHDGRGADPLDDTVPRTTKPGEALPLSDRAPQVGFTDAGQRLLTELSESPLPGAKYAYTVVRGRLARIEAEARAARSQPDEGLLREALLERIRQETREAVIEGDASDCSSPDCIADAVYEIVRVALALEREGGLDHLISAAPLAGETGPRLDVELVKRLLAAPRIYKDGTVTLDADTFDDAIDEAIHAANHPVAEAGEP